MGEQHNAPPERKYPPFYEKLIPLALVAILVAIVVLLLIILAVILGLFPPSG